MAYDGDVITLVLSVDEAAMVWECVDWCRLSRKLSRSEDAPNTPTSLLSKIERQLGLTESQLKGTHTQTQSQTQTAKDGSTQTQTQTETSTGPKT